MGTPLSKVYKKFLSQIDDKEWLLVEDEVIEDLMFEYLESATVDFTQCRKDLSILQEDSGVEEYPMDGFTNEIVFNPKDDRIPIISIRGALTGQEYFDKEDYVYEDGMVRFSSPPTEDIVLEWKIEGEFNEELDNTEIRILAHGMVLHYLKPKILTLDSLKQYVSDKDFSKLSGANMLLRLMGLEKAQQKHYEVLQAKYAFKGFEGWN